MNPIVGIILAVFIVIGAFIATPLWAHWFEIVARYWGLQ